MVMKKPGVGCCGRGRPGTPEPRLAVRSWVWLSLGVIFILSALFPPGTRAGREISFQEKGHQAMQQAAPAQNKDLPPIDASQPTRFETFTFGLG